MSYRIILQNPTYKSYIYICIHYILKSYSFHCWQITTRNSDTELHFLSHAHSHHFSELVVELNWIFFFVQYTFIMTKRIVRRKKIFFNNQYRLPSARCIFFLISHTHNQRIVHKLITNFFLLLRTKTPIRRTRTVKRNRIIITIYFIGTVNNNKRDKNVAERRRLFSRQLFNIGRLCHN